MASFERRVASFVAAQTVVRQVIVMRLAAFCWVVLLLAAPRRVGAQSVPTSASSAQGPELQWHEEDRSSGWGNVAFIGATGAIALAGLIIEPDRRDPWRATLGVDEGVRSGLRLTDSGARRTARTASDLLAGVVVTYPMVIEAGLNAAWAKASPRVGLELGVMQLEVLGLTAALVNTSKWVFGRERPYGRLCGTELSATSEDCEDSDRYASYFSGHAAFTFASATVICVQHTRWNLWGNAPAWVPCTTSYALAATTALLRVGADRHYISDITTGAIVGTAVGLVVPWFHYQSKAARADQPSWSIGVAGGGVSLAGQF